MGAGAAVQSPVKARKAGPPRPSVHVPDAVLQTWRGDPTTWRRRSLMVVKEDMARRWASVMLDGFQGSEVARSHGITREAVRQAVAKVNRKLLAWPERTPFHDGLHASVVERCCAAHVLSIQDAINAAHRYAKDGRLPRSWDFATLEQVHRHARVLLEKARA